MQRILDPFSHPRRSLRDPVSRYNREQITHIGGYVMFIWASDATVQSQFLHFTNVLLVLSHDATARICKVQHLYNTSTHTTSLPPRRLQFIAEQSTKNILEMVFLANSALPFVRRIRIHYSARAAPIPAGVWFGNFPWVFLFAPRGTPKWCTKGTLSRTAMTHFRRTKDVDCGCI